MISEKRRLDCAYDLHLGLDPLSVKMTLAQKGDMVDLQRKAQPIQNDSW